MCVDECVSMFVYKYVQVCVCVCMRVCMRTMGWGYVCVSLSSIALLELTSSHSKQRRT